VSKLIVRQATPDDTLAIRRRDPNFPDVGDPVILECLVVEKDGEVIGSLCFEKSVRLCFTGSSPEALAALHDLQNEVFRLTKEAGIRFAHCLLSKAGTSVEEVSHHLKESGFERCDDLVEHVLDLGRVEDRNSGSLSQLGSDNSVQPKWLM
jgi:hypothetical protein